MLQLRDYQRASLDALQAAWGGAGGSRLRDGLIVLPTGAGKSLVIAALARASLERAPEARIVVVTHSRELIAQNHRELVASWPEAPAGIFSAGLGRREAEARILVCGIQSVWDKLGAIGPRDLVIVDEAHLIPRAAETRYGRFLAGLRALRPEMRVVGFTATPYRLDSGRLDEGEGRLFERIVYEANVGDLIQRGWLSPLVSKATLTALDVSGVGRRGGDYIPSQLEAAVNQDWITRAAVEEMVGYGRSRRAWLAFCAGLAHAEAVRDAVRREGYSCETISGETPRRQRDRLIAGFRTGRIRCLTSVGVLATGFNVPEVDLVALLRPTQSTGLYVQQVGRALRQAPGKADALILDYAGLVRMHGPVDIVTARTAAQVRGREGEVRAKPCPGCGALIALNASTCEACWVEPEAEEEGEARHEAAAEDALPILSEPVTQALRARASAPWRPVTGWALEASPGGLAIALACPEGGHRVHLDLEASGYAREKAVLWWRGLGGGRDAPTSADEALARLDELERPASLRLRPAGRLNAELGLRFADGRVFADTRRAEDLAA
ncbi:DEAD/DEAH box helicase [Methylobacterium dankookense]|uniref:ATP-dependent RNA helicase RhlB n=1 Tax=Methylobacterium dankookense TaxID=560405 RepID=A0A564G987_9HYPH|nr:DEAD/DEAH box helicase [Methylobacterium dankookense]GJD58629.1 ATP-dependent RNA helicase RhlB [Methylobacterium dankookense]VUF16111.1 Putative DNA repair helicase RadD [Methylobacterium dankookense]